MSHFGAHVHKSHQIFNGQVDKQKLCKALNAPNASWSHWFHQGKAFASKTDSRSYAQVVASSNSIILLPMSVALRKGSNLPLVQYLHQLSKTHMVAQVANIQKPTQPSRWFGSVQTSL